MKSQVSHECLFRDEVLFPNLNFHYLFVRYLRESQIILWKKDFRSSTGATSMVIINRSRCVLDVSVSVNHNSNDKINSKIHESVMSCIKFWFKMAIFKPQNLKVMWHFHSQISVNRSDFSYSLSRFLKRHNMTFHNNFPYDNNPYTRYTLTKFICKRKCLFVFIFYFGQF